MNPENELQQLLRRHGAVLVRWRKHEVYRFPSGRTYTLPSTPSDRRYADNALTDLRHFLSLERQVHKNPNRRLKPGVAGHAEMVYDVPSYTTGWKLQLSRCWTAIMRRRAREGDVR